jgi:hypothetical protein
LEGERVAGIPSELGWPEGERGNRMATSAQRIKRSQASLPELGFTILFDSG